jgi:plastocyanin
MKRRAVLVVVMTLVAATLPGFRAVAADSPAASRLGCQPDPTIQGEQTLHCRYGPLAVTPGTNMIVFGPVSIESPRVDGYITSFSPNLELATTGEVPPIHKVHLHHGVWLNATSSGTTPFFATGEEKTRSQIPAGYGYRTSPADAWVLNYMIHNLSEDAYSVFIDYDLTWLPLTTPNIKNVVPVWLDAVGQKEGISKSVYPVYDPRQDGSGYTATFSADQDAELVWVGGHVHPGGLRDDLTVHTCNGQPAGDRLLFSSQAVPNTSPAPDDGPVGSNFGSWDYRMTVTPGDWRYTMRKGDQITVTGYYDTAHPWYEAMAIMFAWAHPLTPEEAAASPSLCGSPPTTGAVTALPDGFNPAHLGGGGETARAPSNPPPATTTQIAIAGFNYYPSGGKASPAGVKPGATVTFTNLDAGASIFHTVTSCTNPCNGDTGQKYPLASWPSDSAHDLGDSGQLGFGPPYATAATQKASWSFTVPGDAPPGELFTFFCRIHPDMRGSLEVVGP